MSPHRSTTRSTTQPTLPTLPTTARVRNPAQPGDHPDTTFCAPLVPAAEVLHLLRLLAATGPREQALLEALSAALRHRDLLAHPDVTAARHNAAQLLNEHPAGDSPALADGAHNARPHGCAPTRSPVCSLGAGEDLIDWPATVAAAAQEVEDRLRDVEDVYRHPVDGQTPLITTTTATGTALENGPDQCIASVPANDREFS